MVNSDNLVIVALLAVGGFLAAKTMNAGSGPGEAGAALGSTAGGFLDFGGNVASGIADRVGSTADFAGGGLADVIRVPGTLGEDAYNLAGDGLDFGLGGAADVIRDADAPDLDAPDLEEPDWDGDGEPGGSLF